MECPRCGYLLAPLETECPRCKAGYSPAPTQAAQPLPPIRPIEERLCPRCGSLLLAGQLECPNCIPRYDGLVPLAEQRTRRWKPTDIFLASAMLCIILANLLTFSFLSMIGLLSLVVTVGVYGLVLLDIWQDENSFGGYAYLLTAWNLTWNVIGLVVLLALTHGAVLGVLGGMDIAGLIINVIILIGLWKRYGSPFDRWLGLS